MLKNYLKKYFIRALIAACIYCITVGIFLTKAKYQSVWLLFLGNALYMLTAGTLIYLSNKVKRLNHSSVTSTISGHILSLTGAAISVILSVLLYLAFSLDSNGEKLHKAPASLSANPIFSMLLILMVTAALGNTIAGFFAVLFTSFDTSSKKPHN
ncbi:MAG TPA: hypothetical protein VFW07_21340 [Parafilimonas sp.]|nr:hypothetical protein [Parafilimonas sp.]